MRKYTFLLFAILLFTISCAPYYREYSLEDQRDLAVKRVQGMADQLNFEYTFEESSIQFGEPIPVTLYLSNETETPIVARIPRQSDMLDAWAPNSVLFYSITPVDTTIFLETLTPTGAYIFGEPLLPDDFQKLESRDVREVNLEIPNLVYIKQGDTWVESKLPPGKYWINITYENLDIGYEIDNKNQIYYADISAWVGKIETEPVLLTILP